MINLCTGLGIFFEKLEKIFEILCIVAKFSKLLFVSDFAVTFVGNQCDSVIKLKQHVNERKQEKWNRETEFIYM